MILEEKHEFELSINEREYLNQLASCNGLLVGLLKFHEGVSRRKVIIRLSRSEAEQLRDYLTTQLAKVGFDKNYSPNQQGQILEELIDRFYLK